MKPHERKADRIAMVERNLAENDRRLAAGVITEKQHAANRRDGQRCISEIRARRRP